MGANAQIAVPAFTAGQVLTAAQQTQINTGIPVFATTITRDAAFDGAGEKTLAEGQFAYIEATNTTQYYDGAAWVSIGATPGLTYINTFTGTATAAINCTSAFSATYQNYRIIYTQTAAVGSNDFVMRLRLGGTDATTNYNCVRLFGNGSTAGSSSNPTGTDDWFLGNTDGTNPYALWSIDLARPFDAAPTYINAVGFYNSVTPTITPTQVAGQNTNSTSYDGFSMITTATSITGTVRVYGYNN
jgi:hypothetical protein